MAITIRNYQLQKTHLLIAGTLLGTLGIATLIFTLAASNFASLEPESATLSKGAVQITDNQASGGKALRFAAATPPPTPTPPSPPTSATQRFPGDPNPLKSGKTYWGMAGSGIDNIESSAGRSVSIYRTYQPLWAPFDKLYSIVTSDFAKNRLPWVSVKPPSWQGLADGKYDKDLDAMLKQLDSYGKPVWLTFHHEPEGGGEGGNTPDDPGGAAAWRAMQKHVRARMDALGTKHIAFMPIVMSYTWAKGSGRNPDDWWVPNVWDVFGFDAYQKDTSGTYYDKAQFADLLKWLKGKGGMPYAIGEMGIKGGTDAEIADDMQGFWDWVFSTKQDMVGAAWWNTDAYNLSGAKLSKYIGILSDNRVMHINDLK